jgi:hypothetical protein
MLSTLICFALVFSSCRAPASFAVPTTKATPSNLPSAPSSVQTQPATGSEPFTPLPNSSQILSQSISAMNQVSSFELDSDIIDTFDTAVNGITTESIYEWESTRLVDVARKHLQMSIDLDSLVSNMRPNTEPFHLELYAADGWRYTHGYHYPVFTGSRDAFPWSKAPLDESWWSAQTQIDQQIGLMQDAVSTTLWGSEIVKGIDCYVVSVIPSDRAVTDCIASQRQDAGAQIGRSGSPQITHGALFKVWIAKDSLRIIKSSLNAVFEVNLNVPPVVIISPTPTPANTTSPGGGATSVFHGLWNFSGYNQPVTVQLPPEASTAAPN